jgi:drug/metabolite transporter (DMT)-like permease
MPVAETTELKLRKSGALKYELLLLIVSVIWGSAFAAQQIGMQRGLGPMTFNGWRFALGSLALVPVIFWRKKITGRARVAGKLPYMGSVAAGIFLFAAAGFQQIGLQYTSSANSGFITGFYILFVPLIGIFFGHRATNSLWGAILVCLAGLYLLSVSEDFVVSKGDLLTLICAVLWACQILVIDHVAGKGDPIQIALLQFAICAVLSLAAGVLFENCTFSQIQAAWGAIAYAGIMSVGIAFTMQVVCQKRCSPGPAAILMSLEAVFAALAGYLVLNQTPTSRAMVGCGLILCGVLIVQLAPMRRNLKAATQPLQPEPNELHADNRRISVLALACHGASNDSVWSDKGESVEPLR